MKRFLLLIPAILLSFFIFLSTPHSVSAQYAVGCASTAIGKPTGPSPTCASSSAGGNGSFVYYCQGDPKWGNSCGAGDAAMNACLAGDNGSDPEYCGMGKSGCGPTSLAMIMSTFGVVKTPLEIDAIFQSNGWRPGCDAGSDVSKAISSDWFINQGFVVAAGIAINSDGHPDLTQMKNALSQGYLIINSVTSYPCLGCFGGPDLGGVGVSHYMVVDDVDIPGNRIHTRDPNNCSYATGQEVQEHAWVSLSLPRSQYGASNAVWQAAWPIKRK